MSNQPTVRITIAYRTIEDTKWESLELTPEEYFDLEPGEKADLDSVPKHNHAIQYLAKSPESIRMTQLTLVDLEQNLERSITETFWNRGKNRVIERMDKKFTPYWEMIIEIKIADTPPLWEILRLHRQNGMVVPVYHAYIQDNPDGSQTENNVPLI